MEQLGTRVKDTADQLEQAVNMCADDPEAALPARACGQPLGSLIRAAHKGLTSLRFSPRTRRVNNDGTSQIATVRSCFWSTLRWPGIPQRRRAELWHPSESGLHADQQELPTRRASYLSHLLTLCEEFRYPPGPLPPAALGSLPLTQQRAPKQTVTRILFLQAAQLKERDRQGKAVTAKVDTGMTKKKEKSIDASGVGASIPGAGGALAKYGARKSATRSAFPSVRVAPAACVGLYASSPRVPSSLCLGCCPLPGFPTLCSDLLAGKGNQSLFSAVA